MAVRVFAVDDMVSPTVASPVDGVDIRLVDLALDDRAVARAETSLTRTEITRARRGTPPVHRRRVLLRAALRSALGAELGMEPAGVPLRVAPTGRPFVDGVAVDVSCSASGLLGVVALSRGRRIGVDVEAVSPWSPEALEEGWLSPGERQALIELSLSGRAEAATRSWTQKEAVLKARGTGLRADPAGTVTTIGRPDTVVAGWEIRDVPVPQGWIASIAVAPRQGVPS